MMEPPILEVTLKRGDKKITMGGEKVMFRHDETFYNPNAIGIKINPNLPDNQLFQNISRIESLSFERVGETLSVQMIALEDDGNIPNFSTLCKKVYLNSSLPLAIITNNNQTLNEIIDWHSLEGLLIITGLENVSAFVGKLKNTEAVLAIRVSDPDQCRQAGEFYRNRELKNCMFALEQPDPVRRLDTLYQVRSRALVFEDRILSFPVVLIARNGQPDEAYQAAEGVMKYASAVITSVSDPEVIYSLLTLRQNVFTDPRRPIQVESKLYSIGDVTPKSPVLVTTNFSLTYFTVAQEVETSRVPAYLLVVDTDGTSVLTAWSADRFNRKSITETIEKTDLTDIIDHNRIIIPGYVSMLKEEIEENTNFKVIVGPREGSGIPGFLKRLDKQRKN